MLSGKPVQRKPLPSHEKKKRFWSKRFLASVLAGSIVTLAVGVVLWFFQVSVNVILPVLAPIWVGGTALAYTVLGDRLH
jgi:uncharacterized membrane protein YdbT with pleckstrin-like domain